MSTNRYHIAQANIGRVRAPLIDPVMAEFVSLLAPINALADQSPGFVWRLQTEAGNATDLHLFEDDRILLNMSVWESIEALRDYVYRSDHVRPLRRRKEWFETLEGPITVLWWVPSGYLPTPDEGRERLELLQRLGPTRNAFTFKQTFPPE